MLAATHSSNQTGLIAFGSNQGDSLQVYEASIDALQRIAGVNVVAHSEPIWTAPITGRFSVKSPDSENEQLYLNAVIRIATKLSPSELHLQTAAIERQFGRVRSGHWQARVIDLDLLLLGDQIVDTRSLTLPHPRMSFRRFVLEPAAEIAAELTHPVANCSIAALLKRINSPNKIMALVCPKICPKTENPTDALDKLVFELSKIDPRWQFVKVFSAEKLFQLDSNLTVVVAFSAPFDGPTLSEEIKRNDLQAAAVRFAGPSLRLKILPSDPLALTELTAILQTIG